MSRVEYIEREAAMQAVCKGCNIEFSDEPCELSDCDIRNELLMVPSADVAPVVHGRWVYDEASAKWGYPFVCSNPSCKKAHDFKEKYCPNCGAKMDEKEGDNEQIN